MPDRSAETQAPTPGWAWLLAGGLLLLHATCGWLARTPGVTHSNDDALYVLLGEQLRHRSYRESFHVGAPFHGQYPPGWPALLALTSAVSGDRLEVAFALVMLLSTAGLALFFDAARRLVPAPLALAALAGAAVNTLVVNYAGRMMSEAAYLFWTALALWSAVRNADSRRQSWLTGGAALAATLTRMIGVTLVGGVILAWLLERRWRRALVLAVLAGVVVGGWLVWSARAPEKVAGRSYVADAALVATDQQGTGPVARVRSVVTRATELVTMTIPRVLAFPKFEGTLVDNVAWLVLIVGGGGAGLLWLWGKWRLLVLYLLGYGALLCLWPWAPRRFWIPVQPFVLLAILGGTWAVAHRVWRRGAMVAPLLVTALVLAEAIPGTAANVARGLRCDRSDPWHSEACYDPDQRSFFAAATYARDSLPAAAIYLVEREAAFAYHSGRRVVHAERLLEVPDSLFRTVLAERGVSYVLLGRLTDVEVGRLSKKLLATCEHFVVQASFPPHTLLLRLVQADGGTEPNACEAVQRYRATTPTRNWSN